MVTKIEIQAGQKFLGLELCYPDGVLVVPDSGRILVVQSGKKIVINAPAGSIVGGSNIESVEL